MASSRSQLPLLRRPSDPVNGQEEAEKDSLLTGKPSPESNSRQWRWREIILLTWAGVATAAVVVLAVLFNGSYQVGTSGDHPNGKRNLIFMVSDGMGPTSLGLTRSFRHAIHGVPYDGALVLDKFMIGTSRTKSSSSLITDSAAGATAFSCGKKSYNGAVATLQDYSPCGTVLEAAKSAGYKTGLVVTTRITDATPACFAAHVRKRENEDLVAQQLLGDYPLGRTVDLILGAGRCHFLGNNTVGSCRKDAKDLIKSAKHHGFTYVGNRQDFDGLQQGRAAKLPLLGLFANEDIPYEVDRLHEKDTYPSLQEMTLTALTALKEATADSDKGFFLMIEGSRIDHAGHANDPATQVHEVLAYDLAFQSVIDFLRHDKTNGLLVATSDHETGGLGAGRQLEPFTYPEYHWFPKVLANASHSTEWLTREYAKHMKSLDKDASVDAEAYLRKAIPENLGVYDVTDDEIKLLLEKPDFALWLFADIISQRSETGWTTHGHSGADVNVYASDWTAAKSIVGNHDNTEIGIFLRDFLEVDVEAITAKLKSRGAAWDARMGGDVGWMGKIPTAGERTDGGSHMDRNDFGPNRRCSEGM